MKRIWKVFLSLSAILLFLTSCSEEAIPPNSERPQVVTSIYPVYEIVKKVAGDRADVSLMIGENEDAHHYEPSAQAVASVNEADVFIYNSEIMEFWADSLLDVIENDHLYIIEMSDGLDLSVDETSTENAGDDHAQKEGEMHDHGVLDPHFWLNPIAVRESLSVVVEGLSKADPEGVEIYQENAVAFAKELDELDHAYQEAFNGAKNRSFVVQHQAFGHLAEKYNLKQVSVGGLNTEIEPNPQALANIVNFVKDNNIPIIYYQSGESSSTAEVIVNETDTKIAILYDLESKPEDSQFTDSSYIEMMYHNLEELKKSIQ